MKCYYIPKIRVTDHTTCWQGWKKWQNNLGKLFSSFLKSWTYTPHIPDLPLLSIYLTEIKAFIHTKETLNKLKRQLREWEEVFVYCVSDKVLITKIYEEVMQINDKNNNNNNNKVTRNLLKMILWVEKRKGPYNKSWDTFKFWGHLTALYPVLSFNISHPGLEFCFPFQNLFPTLWIWSGLNSHSP